MEDILFKATVLVVDDEVANLKVFERVFRKEFRIIAAASGAAALAAIVDTQPDVAFVDLRMPGMDGAAVLAALRQARPETTRYLLTGFGDLSEVSALVAEGLCVGVLPKPWDRETIRTAVTAAVPTASRTAR